MDIFISDPNQIPLPPDETRILNLDVDPLPEVGQIKVSVEISPFLTRPNIEIDIETPEGHQVASASIIESITTNNEINLHIRNCPKQTEYVVKVQLYYLDTDKVPDPGLTTSYPEWIIVDSKSESFFF